MYCTCGLLTLTLQFGAKIFQLGRAVIRDWRVQSISSSVGVRVFVILFWGLFIAGKNRELRVKRTANRTASGENCE